MTIKSLILASFATLALSSAAFAGNSSSVFQQGNYNGASTKQVGASNDAQFWQQGDHNAIKANQDGFNNNVGSSQFGDHNKIGLKQKAW